MIRRVHRPRRHGYLFDATTFGVGSLVGVAGISTFGVAAPVIVSTFVVGAIATFVVALVWPRQ